jgi:hypothetical protein
MRLAEPIQQLDLPDPVRELALRLGAKENGSATSVHLEQRGVMQNAPGSRQIAFKARQRTAIDAIDFSWRARCGPLGAVSVRDYLHAGRGGVEVHALGMIPLVRLIDDPAVLKGETMRYLAELPLAPDAILRNRQLAWRVIDAETLIVSTRAIPEGGDVTFHLSADGLVSTMEAAGRPRREGGATVERPWRGQFREYRQFDGRTVPTYADVSWLLDGGEFLTWCGEVTSWGMR